MFVCNNFFLFCGKISTAWKIYVLWHIQNINLSSGTHDLIVPYVVSHISYPLGHTAPLNHRVFICIFILDETMLIIKKNKRLIILIHLTSKMYKKLFIQHLISSHHVLILRPISSHPKKLGNKFFVEI